MLSVVYVLMRTQQSSLNEFYAMSRSMGDKVQPGELHDKTTTSYTKTNILAAPFGKLMRTPK